MTVTCIKCGASGNVSVDVECGAALYCGECEESYTVADVEAVMNEWGVILPWLKSHPAQQQTPACRVAG